MQKHPQSTTLLFSSDKLSFISRNKAIHVGVESGYNMQWSSAAQMVRRERFDAVRNDARSYFLSRETRTR